MAENKENDIQWHPAFYAALRLDFMEDADVLEFSEEYYLTDAPMKIDYIVIKKNPDAVLKNGIGRIFRGHNLIEYKSPDDELNMSVFYKSVAYACLYKISPRHETEVAMADITVTMLRAGIPREMFRELKRLGYVVGSEESGIYRIEGNLMCAMQVVVSSELDAENHLQLKALTNRISKELYLDYIREVAILRGRERTLADNVLQAVSRANDKKIREWKEANPMCEALRDIMKEEIEAEKKIVLAEGRERGLAEGRAEGKTQGERLMADLMDRLFSDGRIDEAKMASRDEKVREQFYREYHLI